MISRKEPSLVLIIFFLWVPFIAIAGDVNLPKTGQTTCYDQFGNVISCPGTGQDGDLRVGIKWPNPRFVDNGDGTVTDGLTGLIWLKNANCFGQRTWSQALADCKNLANGSCGLTDGSAEGEWRLPNIVELDSLINSDEPAPSAWLGTQGFSAVQQWRNWSATTSADSTDSAWCVRMYNGNVNSYNKADTYHVWPVRGGQ